MAELLAASDYAQVVDWRAVAGLCVIAGFVLAMAVLLAAVGVFDRWLYDGRHHINQFQSSVTALKRETAQHIPPRDSVWTGRNEQNRQGGELADARRGGEER